MYIKEKKEIMISKEKTLRQFYIDGLLKIHKNTSQHQFCEEIANCMIDPIEYIKKFTEDLGKHKE